jgi:hypothetical protein
LELWEFAAQYGFTELEQYCLTDPLIYAQIRSIIRDPSRGIKVLLEAGVPVGVVSGLVCDIMVNQIHALLRHTTVDCDNCKRKPIYGLRFKCMNCVNFDLCEDCYPLRGQFHSFHSTYHEYKQIPG